MKIYVSHSRKLDFKPLLYDPLKQSELAKIHQFIFPHENSMGDYPSKRLMNEKGCDLVLAEVSYQTTGQGLELGWADDSAIRIIFIYKTGSEISKSLWQVSSDFIEYSDPADMIEKLVNFIK